MNSPPKNHTREFLLMIFHQAQTRAHYEARNRGRDRELQADEVVALRRSGSRDMNTRSRMSRFWKHLKARSIAISCIMVGDIKFRCI